MSKYYDHSVLEETAGGDKNFVNQLVQIFLDSAPADFEKLIQHYESGEIEEAGKVAHKMKGSSRSMGIYIWETLYNIEQIGKKNIPQDKLPDEIEKLKTDFPEIIKELKEEL